MTSLATALLILATAMISLAGSVAVISDAVAIDKDDEKPTPPLRSIATDVSAVNATEAWQRLLYNQAKYDRHGAAAGSVPGGAGGGGGGGGLKLTDVPFEEQDYSREDVLLRPGQMIELLGFSNYQPYYMRLEAPPPQHPSSQSPRAGYNSFYSSSNNPQQLEGDLDGQLPDDAPTLEELLQQPPLPQLKPPQQRSRHRPPQQQQQRQRQRHHKLRFLRRQQRRKLRRYLLAHTACRVGPGWRDLGKAYWPRWLRQGECLHSQSGSCSIPPGMRCQPAGFKRLFLLRYLCAKHWRRSQCRWVKQNVTVLDTCACKC